MKNEILGPATVITKENFKGNLLIRAVETTCFNNMR